MNRRDILKAFFGGIVAAPIAAAGGLARVTPRLELPPDPLLSDWLAETLKTFEAMTVASDDGKIIRVRYRQKKGYCNVNDVRDKFCAGKKPTQWTMTMQADTSSAIHLGDGYGSVELQRPEVFLDVVYA